MRVFKVTRQRCKLARLRSAIIRAKGAELTYQAGRETRPKFGRVFAFDTFENAEAFSDSIAPDRFSAKQIRIWEADAPDAEPIEKIADLVDPFNADAFGLEYFWAGYPITALRPPPPGTVACSALTLRRKIQ